MIIGILRTYHKDETFTDEEIQLPDDWWERKIVNENGEFIQYPENMIKVNQSIIDPDDLKDPYWKERWSHEFCRPGHIFRCEYVMKGDDEDER